MPEKLLNIKEVAGILGISENEVRHLVDIGEIPAYKIGNTFLRFRKEQIEAIRREITLIEESVTPSVPEVSPGPKERPSPGPKERPTTYQTEYDYTLFERIKDFIYYYDFYIFSLSCIFGLLYIIFNR